MSDLETFSSLRRQLQSHSQLTRFERQFIERRKAKRAELLAQGMDERNVDRAVDLRVGRSTILSPADLTLALTIANGFWIQKGYVCQSAFRSNLQQLFDIDVESLDFVERPAESSAMINAWVADQTRGLVNAVLAPTSLTSLTRAILTNTAYFKGKWFFRFSPPIPGPFHLLDGSTAQARMMTRTAHIRFYEDESFLAVELPYEHRPVAMVLVIPREVARSTLAEMERELAVGELDRFYTNAQRRDVTLTMPEFAVAQKYDLIPLLEKIGVQNAFGPGADYSGISNEAGFTVDQLKHSARIVVDRYGTEAAAVTMMTAVGYAPMEPVTLVIDRPFLFAIVDGPTKAVLFAGRVVHPSKEAQGQVPSVS